MDMSSCFDEREILLACLSESPCIAAGKPISVCIEEDEACRFKRVALMHCKRGQASRLRRPHGLPRALGADGLPLRAQLDMRKRIKGNFVGNETAEDDKAEMSTKRKGAGDDEL